MFHLKNHDTSGDADMTFGYGAPGAGWLPIAGDWDGDDTDTVGLYDPAASVFRLRNTNTQGDADINLWVRACRGGLDARRGRLGRGCIDTIGLYDPASSWFYVRNANSVGMADIVFGFGAPGAGWLPIVGNWNQAPVAVADYG